jgi:hypothetical protein
LRDLLLNSFLISAEGCIGEGLADQAALLAVLAFVDCGQSVCGLVDHGIVFD